jgi:hypothetical protein
MPTTSKFKGVLAKALADADKVKRAIAVAAADVDGAVIKLEKDAPVIEAVAEEVIPGAGAFVPLGLSLLEAVAEILNAGDAAAEANLKNAGLDEALITAVKAQLANIAKLV